MNRGKVVAHYNKMRLTKAELTDQLAGMELHNEELKGKLLAMSDTADAFREKLGKAESRCDGYQVDLERMQEKISNLIDTTADARREMRKAQDEATGRVDTMQGLVNSCSGDAKIQTDRAAWFKEQRDQLAGVVEGMRPDRKDDGKRRRLDKVLAGLVSEPIIHSSHDFAAPDPMIMEHGPAGWRRR